MLKGDFQRQAQLLQLMSADEETLRKEQAERDARPEEVTVKKWDVEPPWTGRKVERRGICNAPLWTLTTHPPKSTGVLV